MLASPFLRLKTFDKNSLMEEALRLSRSYLHSSHSPQFFHAQFPWIQGLHSSQACGSMLISQKCLMNLEDSYLIQKITFAFLAFSLVFTCIISLNLRLACSSRTKSQCIFLTDSSCLFFLIWGLYAKHVVLDGLGGLWLSPKAHLYNSNISLSLSMPKFSTCDTFMPLMSFGKKSMMHLEDLDWIQKVTLTVLASPLVFPST